MVGFDDGSDLQRSLDGRDVSAINPNLTSETDTTAAVRLSANMALATIGDQKTGPFDVSHEMAREWLALPLNPHGLPNSDVLRPWSNGADVTGRPSDWWIVDFGVSRSEVEAAFYEAPFEHVRAKVKPGRDRSRSNSNRLKVLGA